MYILTFYNDSTNHQHDELDTDAVSTPWVEHVMNNYSRRVYYTSRSLSLETFLIPFVFTDIYCHLIILAESLVSRWLLPTLLSSEPVVLPKWTPLRSSLAFTNLPVFCCRSTAHMLHVHNPMYSCILIMASILKPWNYAPVCYIRMLENTLVLYIIQWKLVPFVLSWFSLRITFVGE